MNKLSNEKRAQILSVLCEGMGINAACRITGASKNTVLKLLANVAKPAQSIKMSTCVTLLASAWNAMRYGLYVGMKQKNMPEEWGTQWLPFLCVNC